MRLFTLVDTRIDLAWCVPTAGEGNHSDSRLATPRSHTALEVPGGIPSPTAFTDATGVCAAALEQGVARGGDGAVDTMQCEATQRNTPVDALPTSLKAVHKRLLWVIEVEAPALWKRAALARGPLHIDAHLSIEAFLQDLPV